MDVPMYYISKLVENRYKDKRVHPIVFMGFPFVYVELSNIGLSETIGLILLFGYK